MTPIRSLFLKASVGGVSRNRRRRRPTRPAACDMISWKAEQNRHVATKDLRPRTVRWCMPHTTPPANDAADLLANPNAQRARNGSGFFEIDLREGFERGVREAVENAMRCYRDAAKARAAGDELEAHSLVEVAEQSLDVARDLLRRLEGL